MFLLGIIGSSLLRHGCFILIHCFVLLSVNDLIAIVNDPGLSDLSELDEIEDEYEDLPSNVRDGPSQTAENISTSEMIEEEFASTSVIPEGEETPNSETIEEDEEDNELIWTDGVFDPVIQPFVPLPTTSSVEVRSPLGYFREFITDEMMELCVEQTNIYSVQKSGVPINTGCGRNNDLF